MKMDWVPQSRKTSGNLLAGDGWHSSGQWRLVLNGTVAISLQHCGTEWSLFTIFSPGQQDMVKIQAGQKGIQVDARAVEVDAPPFRRAR